MFFVQGVLKLINNSKVHLKYWHEILQMPKYNVKLSTCIYYEICVSMMENSVLQFSEHDGLKSSHILLDVPAWTFFMRIWGLA